MSEWQEGEPPINQEIEYVREIDGETIVGSVKYHADAGMANSVNRGQQKKRLYRADGYERAFHVVRWRTV